MTGWVEKSKQEGDYSPPQQRNDKGKVERRLKRTLGRATTSTADRAAVNAIANVLYSKHVTAAQLSKALSSYQDMDAFLMQHDLTTYQRLMHRALQKKDIYKPNALLDNILTFVFVLEIGFCFYIFSESMSDLLTYSACLVFVAACVKIAKYVFLFAGRFLSQLVHRLGCTADEPLAGRRQMKKWLEQGWQFVIHLSMALFEMYILMDEPWWEDTRTAFQPRADLQHHKFSLRLFYMVQLVSSRFAHSSEQYLI